MNDKKLEQVKELEQLEIIQSEELKVGNAFHAFRFAGTLKTEDEQKTNKK